ncbi:MAG: TetR/AcrR family transcriptional regulator [Proteocatella sp.]
MKIDYSNNIWTDTLIGDDEQLTEKQMSIIKSTAILFRKNGYEATSTREIAKLANVAEGTIFKHYGTKKELLLEVVGRIARAMLIPAIMTGIDDILDDEYDSLDDFVYRFIYNRIEVVTNAAPLIKIVIQELPFHPEIREIINMNMSVLPFNRVFDKLKADKFIIDLPNDELFKLIVSTVGGYLITHYVLLPEFFNKNPKKELENLVEFIVRGVKNYG